jgi:major histocompatibility complex class I
MFRGVIVKNVWEKKKAHAFNPSTWEAEAGGFLSLRPAWSTE